MQQAVRSQAEALLEAGLRLSRRVPLARVTTAVIATEAGLPSIRFFDAYPDLSSYLIDLYQRHFLLPVRQRLEQILSGAPPGLERTRAATQAYLDFCLKQRGLRRWTIDARQWPEFDAAYNRASQGIQTLAEGELQGLGFRNPAGAARLFAAMVYEIALVEVEEGHEHYALRQCLWRLLGFRDRPLLQFAPREAVREPPAPTTTATPRQRLLRAGEALLRDHGGQPEALKLEALLARADVDRDGFAAAFGDLQAFELALIQSWTEQFMATCLAASQGLPPGTERLHAFLTAAWDCNLHEQRGQRMLMKALLRTDPELRARILTRVQGFPRIVAMEFQALGLASPQALARLFVAASTELVEAEETAAVPLPRLRETFWQWFDPLTAGARPAPQRSRELRARPEVAQTSFLTMQIGEVPGTGRHRRRSAEARAALRQRLLEAGDRLLLTGARLEAFSANRLALLAGVEAEDFSDCYGGWDDYLAALFGFLLDEVRDITVEATAHMNPGIPRMWRGIEAYLDARLDRPVIHELSRRLQGHAEALRLSRGRSAAFVRIFATEFRSAGWQDAEACGHLMTALVSETVQAEYEAGRRLPEYRNTLRNFLERG
jgi:TetR/AcrR family transcriptional regulator, transcriptional repressor for nem operon